MEAAAMAQPSQLEQLVSQGLAWKLFKARPLWEQSVGKEDGLFLQPFFHRTRCYGCTQLNDSSCPILLLWVRAGAAITSLSLSLSLSFKGSQ